MPTCQEDLKQAAIACQTMAATAHHVSTMNGHVKDKNVEATIWWQQRSAHWSGIARRLRDALRP